MTILIEEKVIQKITINSEDSCEMVVSKNAPNSLIEFTYNNFNGAYKEIYFTNDEALSLIKALKKVTQENENENNG